MLDGIRVLAALAVVMYHFAFRMWTSATTRSDAYPVIGDIAQYGYLGVDLFFALSGFVILMSASRGSARAFLASRALRLYPAYWVCATATFLFCLLWPVADNEVSLGQWLINLTMLQGPLQVDHIDGSYWTLTIELIYYAAIAIVLRAGLLHRIDGLLAAWLVLSIAADFIPAIGKVGALFAAAWCQYFVAGAIAYRIRSDGFTWLRATILSVAFLQAVRHAMWTASLKERLTNVSYDHATVMVVVLAIFLLLLLLALGRLGWRAPWLRPLGALTYPLYVVHGVIGTAVLGAWISAGGERWLALTVVTAGAIAAAYALHRWAEVPVTRWLRAWPARRASYAGT